MQPEVIYLFEFTFTLLSITFLMLFALFMLYKSKAIKVNSNIDLIIDLSEWQDIPNFASKEDIELYLKNKSDNIDKKSKGKTFDIELARFILKYHSLAEFKNYSRNWRDWDYSYYEKDFAKYNLLPKREQEILYEKRKKLNNFLMETSN